MEIASSGREYLGREFQSVAGSESGNVLAYHPIDSEATETILQFL